AIADVYDALATLRPYRPAIPHANCLEILRTNAAGGGLDPDLVKAFCKLMAEKGPCLSPGSKPDTNAPILPNAARGPSAQSQIDAKGLPLDNGVCPVSASHAIRM